MLKFTTITYLLLLLALSCASNYLPSNFPKCYRDDTKLNECMLKAFNQLRERTRVGIKEIGLLPLDKIVTPLTLKQESPVINFTGISSNFTIKGMDSYDITEFSYDPEKMIIRFIAKFDSILNSGYGSVNGIFAGITINGIGWFSCDIGPIEATVEIKGKLKGSKGIDFYDTKDVTVNLIIEDGIYHVDGYFDNNDLLNSLTNRALNENSKTIAKIITPVFEKFAKTAVMRFMKRLTKRIPYNDILPLHYKS